jgi:hypothetical protein
MMRRCAAATAVCGLMLGLLLLWTRGHAIPIDVPVTINGPGAVGGDAAIVFSPIAPATATSGGLSVSSDLASGSGIADIVAVINGSGSPTLSFGGPNFDDGGLLALSGTELVVNPSGPGLATVAGTTQYVTITASDATASISRTLAITITSAIVVGPPPPPGINCPTAPPPPAQRAGYTTLAYCLDGAAAANATLTNWLRCDQSSTAGSKLWEISFIGQPCDTSHYSQGIDPATGKTTIHYHENFSTDGTQQSQISASTGVNTNYAFGAPANSYWEIRFRTTPNGSRSGNPAPDYYAWSWDACDHGGCTGNVAWAPLENDIIELYQNGTGSAGTVDWSSGLHGHFMYPGTAIGNYIPGYAPDQQHTYGMLVTGDLSLNEQRYAGYVDETLIAWNDPNNFTDNPFTYCMSANCSFSGSDESPHLIMNYFPNLWLGGYDQDTDTYIEYIAVWTCANPATNHCNNGLTQ